MEPKGYYDPPSEREWTPEEMEEFFAGQDALTLDFNTIPKQSPIEFSTGWWNGPVIPLSSDDPFGDLERLIHSGIYITSIAPPAQGWPIATHCPICKETTFLLSLWAKKPDNGDYFKMNGVCARDENHNVAMAIKNVWDAL